MMMNPNPPVMDTCMEMTQFDYMMQFTGNMYTMCPNKPLGQTMKYQGMWRDWLAACYMGSFAPFFGALWLYNQAILLAFIMQLVVLPGWSAGMIYVRYNEPMNNLFTTWWFAAVTVF